MSVMQTCNSTTHIELSTNIDRENDNNSPTMCSEMNADKKKPFTSIILVSLMIFLLSLTLYILTIEQNNNRKCIHNTSKLTKETCTVIDSCIINCYTQECTNNDTNYDCYYSNWITQSNNVYNFSCVARSKSYDNYMTALDHLYYHKINNEYTCYRKYDYLTNKCEIIWSVCNMRYVLTGIIISLTIMFFSIIMIGLYIIPEICKGVLN